jgi:hypothetical protein
MYADHVIISKEVRGSFVTIRILYIEVLQLADISKLLRNIYRQYLILIVYLYKIIPLYI